jgi:hypothetical protein
MNKQTPTNQKQKTDKQTNKQTRLSGSGTIKFQS